MHSIPERQLCGAAPTNRLVAHVVRATGRLLAAACAAMGIATCAWALPTITLAPGGAQSTIILSRPAAFGTFTVDYDFTLASAASAIYNTGRFNLAAPPFGPLRINQFTANLFRLIDDSTRGGALATGVDTADGGDLLSNDFFVARLAAGDYRLQLSGIDEDSGYDGVFRVAPPAPVQFAAPVPEPQSWALLLAALGSLLLARRRHDSNRLPRRVARLA